MNDIITPITTPDQAKQSLKNIVTQYLENGKYFELWFKKEGQSFYFIFKKNVRVTNLPYAELIALVRTYCKSTFVDEENIHIGDRLQFLTVRQFNESMMQLIDCFSDRFNLLKKLLRETEQQILNKKAAQLPKDNKHIVGIMERLKLDDSKVTYESLRENIINQISVEKDKISNQICDLYFDLIRHIIVVDNFYGSCALFINPTFQINLEEICAHSGYIDSCGDAIMIRNVDKAVKEDLFTDLENYFDKNKDLKGPFNFCVYSHEDFKPVTEADKILQGNDSIEELKIYFEKFHMGNHSLVEVYNDLRFTNDATKNLAKKITPKNPKEIRTERFSCQDHKGNDCTIWLVIDHALEDDFKQRGLKRYYICYRQTLKNKSQLHLFDEEKPGWLHSTTLPHTLAGAMLNIAWANRDKDQNVTVIVDPFSGSGTTILEAMRFDKVIAYAYDKEPIAHDLLQFNLDFFSKDVEELENLNLHLTNPSLLSTVLQLKNFIHEISHILSSRGKTLYSFVEEIRSNRDKGNWNCSALQKLKISIEGRTLHDNINKLALFLHLKTKERHGLGILKEGISPPLIEESESDYFNIELKKFTVRLNDKLIRWLKNNLSSLSEESSEVVKPFLLSNGTFSKQINLKPELFANKMGTKVIFKTQEINSLATAHIEQKIDIIITDPPYGFNEEFGYYDLSKVYQTMVEQMVDSLNDNGQIIIALPDKSYSGKHSAYFTHKEVVLNQFFSYASQKGHDIINVSKIVPFKELYSPPYYWESDKALRRSIVHLKFKKRQS